MQAEETMLGHNRSGTPRLSALEETGCHGVRLIPVCGGSQGPSLSQYHHSTTVRGPLWEWVLQLQAASDSKFSSISGPGAQLFQELHPETTAEGQLLFKDGRLGVSLSHSSG